MTGPHDTSTASLLEAALTEFGGRAYGLEPLVLPLTAVDEIAAAGPPATRREPADDGVPAAPDSVEQLFWFRWITGHQLTFLLWRELARHTAGAALVPDPADGVRATARLVRGYSAMLLYTASCTREIYQRIIRPSMALHHPSFSGAWARDYGPVRALLRGRFPAAWDGRTVPLRRECALNDEVHEGIATKLVPSAPSLLAASAGNGRSLPRDMRTVLFDTYFLTFRAPTTPAELLAQLLRRVRAVQGDLRANGLYPDFASSREEKPQALNISPVDEIERAIPELLGTIARHAVRGRPEREGAGSHGV